jgi:hypothetical protein
MARALGPAAGVSACAQRLLARFAGVVALEMLAYECAGSEGESRRRRAKVRCWCSFAGGLADLCQTRSSASHDWLASATRLMPSEMA